MRVRCATRKSWALISLPLVLASCNKHRPADEFHSAHGAMVTGYCSSSATEAEKALLDYRQIAVATKGFDGMIDVNYELGLTDGRLFSVNQHMGRESNALFWFRSSVSNFAISKGSKGLSRQEFATNELEMSLVKLENSLNVRWRTNITSAAP